jgi:hypothetical protein
MLNVGNGFALWRGQPASELIEPLPLLHAFERFERHAGPGSEIAFVKGRIRFNRNIASYREVRRGLPGALARAGDDALRPEFRHPAGQFAGLLMAGLGEWDTFHSARQCGVDALAFCVPHQKECRSFCHNRLDYGVC